MKFNEAANLISQLPRDLAVLFLGPPGIGKSTLAEMIADMDRKQVAEKQGVKPNAINSVTKVCDLACYLPEDLLGVPFKQEAIFGDEALLVTAHAPPRWVGEMSVPNTYGLLLLDDIGAAAKSVQVAAFRLVQERMSGDLKLSDNVRIILTSNRREDKSGASTLPAALLNRMLVVDITPDLEDWSVWYHKMGYPAEITAFLQYKQVHFSKLPKEADERGAFATPRSWEKLAKCLPIAKEQGEVLTVATGLVGEGVATEFFAFTRIVSGLPSPSSILNNPAQALPNVPTDPDKLIALVSGVAEVASKDTGLEMTTKYVFALVHLCQQSYEYLGHSLATYINRAGTEQMSQIVKVVAAHKKDPRVSNLMGELKAALQEGH